MFKFKGFFYIGFLIALIGSMTFGSELCLSFYGFLRKPIEYLDGEYWKVVESNLPNQLHNVQITNLLNRAYFPLVESVSHRIERVQHSEIKKIENSLATSSPVLESQYHAHHSGQLASIPGDSFGQTQVALNGSTTFISRLSQRSEIEMTDGFFYHAADLTRVKRLGPIQHQISLGITPIGGYGRDFAKQMAITIQVISRLIENNSSDISKQMGKKSPA